MNFKQTLNDRFGIPYRLNCTQGGIVYDCYWRYKIFPKEKIPTENIPMEIKE